MKISQPTHKVFLYKLFLDEKGNEKPISLALVNDASSVMKKLKAGSEQAGGTLMFSEDEQEFSIDEAKLLKDLFLGLKTALPSNAPLIAELKTILV